MEYDMVIYESEESMRRDPADTERFEKSHAALKAAGIDVGRVVCSSPADVGEGEARDIVDEKGMGALPICMYQGVSISVGAYPSDQDLADFLDAPDGTLSVNRQGPPAMGNDIPPACGCGNTNPDRKYDGPGKA